MNRTSDEFLRLSEYVVCVEMGAKENLFLWGSGEGLCFCGGLFCFATDLNLGEFTGMSFEIVLSQASQLRLRISRSWFYSFCQIFLTVILAGDSCRHSGLSA